MELGEAARIIAEQANRDVNAPITKAHGAYLGELQRRANRIVELENRLLDLGHAVEKFEWPGAAEMREAQSVHEDSI